MDDKMRVLTSAMSQSSGLDVPSRLLTDRRSGVANAICSAARPRISLTARMLGGQAETVMRFGGLTR